MRLQALQAQAPVQGAHGTEGHTLQAQMLHLGSQRSRLCRSAGILADVDTRAVAAARWPHALFCLTGVAGQQAGSKTTNVGG